MDISSNFVLSELQFGHLRISKIGASNSCSNTGSKVLTLDIIVDN